MNNIELALYLSLSLAWSVGCFLVGYFAGAQARRTLGDVVIPPPSKPAVLPPEEAAKRVPWYRSAQVWIGVLVAGIGLATAAQWYVQGEETRHLAECQSAYSTGFAEALDRRTQESRAVADGQDRLWMIFQEAVTTGSSPEVRERFRVTLNEYLEAREKSKKAQVENPFPPPPKDLCN